MGKTQAYADLSGYVRCYGGRCRRYHCDACNSGVDEKMDVRGNYLNLHSVRKSKGYSAMAVALAVGISYGRYCNIERNESKKILPEERAAISAFFQMSEDALFRPSGDPVGERYACRTRKMPPDEIEAMLAAEYGSKLKPRKNAPKDPHRS